MKIWEVHKRARIRLDDSWAPAVLVVEVKAKDWEEVGSHAVEDHDVDIEAEAECLREMLRRVAFSSVPPEEKS